MLTGKHILIIDDEKHFRFGISLALQQAGYQVSEAKDGEEALTMVRATGKTDRCFDLILVDIQMPGTTGNEFIDELEREGLRIPLVIVSGYADKEVLSKLYDRGYTDILNKPFAPAELISRIRNRFGCVANEG